MVAFHITKLYKSRLGYRRSNARDASVEIPVLHRRNIQGCVSGPQRALCVYKEPAVSVGSAVRLGSTGTTRYRIRSPRRTRDVEGDASAHASAVALSVTAAASSFGSVDASSEVLPPLSSWARQTLPLTGRVFPLLPTRLPIPVWMLRLTLP